MLQSCSGIQRDTPVIAGVMGFERAKRELSCARIERVRAERIDHADDLSARGSAAILHGLRLLVRWTFSRGRGKRPEGRPSGRQGNGSVSTAVELSEVMGHYL
jgi:hypothetical protein